MIVYGDPQYMVASNDFLARLREELNGTNPDSLEAVRALLIRAGQFEQAMHDNWPEPDGSTAALLTRVDSITNSAADVFCSNWAQTSRHTNMAPASRAAALNQMARNLDRLPRTNAPLTIKIPEGFAFYALFPEQYCASALDWTAHRAQAKPKEALVTGIRSIGTSLSAVVAAVLRATGWKILRTTVRPGGHPFARHAELHLPESCRVHHALIVDEGPGLSGSSMAAVAGALARRGIADVAFFPGHDGEPGSAASSDVRSCWANTPRYFTPLEHVRWNGMSLPETLTAKSNELWSAGKCLPSAERGQPRPQESRPRSVRTKLSALRAMSGATPAFVSHRAIEFDAIHDLSAGQWRKFAFTDETQWPAATIPFERMKFLCTRPDHTAVLWKFHGFDSPDPFSRDTPIDRSMSLAADGFVPAPLGQVHGFVAVPWIEGARLTRADAAEPAVLEHVARYLVRAAGPPLSDAETRASLTRLAGMLYWNTKEMLGEAAAEHARSWLRFAENAGAPRTYGDGRLAPHEWIRTRTGQLLKTDHSGHDCDHTIIGRQSLLWDIAGVIVEWDLDWAGASPLLRSVEQDGISFNPNALTFYRMAYAAFRLGMTSPGAGQQPDGSPEQLRHQQAHDHYRRTLHRLSRARIDVLS